MKYASKFKIGLVVALAIFSFSCKNAADANKQGSEGTEYNSADGMDNNMDANSPGTNVDNTTGGTGTTIDTVSNTTGTGTNTRPAGSGTSTGTGTGTNTGTGEGNTTTPPRAQ